MKTKFFYIFLLLTGIALVGCNQEKPAKPVPKAEDVSKSNSDKKSPDYRGVVTKDDLKELSSQRLRELMGHENVWVRAAATQALVVRGQESIPILLDALKDQNWRVVSSAQEGICTILKKIAKEKKQKENPEWKEILAGIPSLKKNLKNKHYYVRLTALKCFQAMGQDAAPAGDAICDCTVDEDFLGVQPNALRTIQAVGPENFDSEKFFEVIEKSVKSPHISVRGAAFGMIEKLDEKEQRKFIPAMKYALGHPMIDGYTRFHLQGRIANLQQKLKVEGTKEQIIAILSTKGWGEAHRVTHLVPVLKKYGADASDALPLLEKKLKSEGRKNLVVIIQDAVDTIKKAKAKEDGGTKK